MLPHPCSQTDVEMFVVPGTTPGVRMSARAGRFSSVARRPQSASSTLRRGRPSDCCCITPQSRAGGMVMAQIACSVARRPRRSRRDRLLRRAGCRSSTVPSTVRPNPRTGSRRTRACFIVASAVHIVFRLARRDSWLATAPTRRCEARAFCVARAMYMSRSVMTPTSSPSSTTGRTRSRRPTSAGRRPPASCQASRSSAHVS